MRDAFSGMLGYDTLLSRSRAVSKSTLLRKCKRIGRAWDVFPEMVADSEEHGMSWWRTYEDVEWLKASGLKGSADDSE